MFYHEIHVCFNFWFVFLPVAVLLAAVIGYQKYYFKNDRIAHRYVDRFMKITSGTMAGVFGLMLAVESFSGILQLSDNIAVMVNSDSEFFSVMLTFVVIIMAPIGLYFLLFKISKRVSEWRHDEMKYDQLTMM